MKKLIIGLFMVSSMIASANENNNNRVIENTDNLVSQDFSNYSLRVFGGTSITGVYNAESDGDKELYRHANDSYSIGVEVLKNINNNFSLGLGTSYQINKKGYNDNSDSRVYSPNFDSVPVYILGKYTFRNEKNLRPYIKAELGYSFNFNGDFYSDYGIKADVDNGLYAGAGFGIDYNNFFTEIMYRRNNTKANLSAPNIAEDEMFDFDSLSYRTISFNVGYKFNF